MTERFKIPAPYDLVFSVTVRVTTEGIFTCTLPENISALFDGKVALGHSGRGRSAGYFKSDTLKGLRASVEKSIETLCSEKEVSREKVIKFAIETACSYAIMDGEMFPYPGGRTGDGWHDGTIDRDATHRGPFGLQIYARPYEKIVYRYESTGKERVEYLNLYEHQFSGSLKDDPIQWLCGMHSLSSSIDSFGHHGLKVQEMPYSDEAALFFIGIFKWLFSVNEKIKPFLHPKGIEDLIASKGAFMLTDGSSHGA